YILLNLGAPREEEVVVLLGTEAHHILNPSPIVPTPVKDDDLARRGEVLDVALHVHLRLVPVRRSGESHDAKYPMADALGDRLDRPALARAVTALKHDDDPQAFIFDPVLELTQLRLQPDQFLLVFLAFQFGLAVIVLLLFHPLVFSFRYEFGLRLALP